MACTQAIESLFAHAAHTYLVNTGHTTPETALLLSRLSEELRDSKPTIPGFKFKRCLSLQPTKFVLETRSGTYWIYAVPCKPVAAVEARVSARGRGGAIAGAGGAARPPVQPAVVLNAAFSLPQIERFKRCAILFSQSHKADVNAHGISTDQMLQVFVRFAQADVSERDSECVVEALCNRNSTLHVRVRMLLDAEWNVDSKAGCVSCFLDLIPLIFLLHRASELRSSTESKYRREVLPLLHDAQFVRSLRDVLLSLSQNPVAPAVVDALAEAQQRNDWYCTWYPRTLQQVFATAVRFFYMMSRFVPDACATFSNLNIVDVLQDCVQQHLDTDVETQATLQRICRIVHPDRVRLSAAVPAMEPIPVSRHASTLFGRQHTVMGPSKFTGDPPSDHFSQKSIIPSARDVLCDESSVYLPLTLDSHIKTNAVEAHLDRHFRWYHESMVAPFRHTINAFLRSQQHVSKMASGIFRDSEADPAVVSSGISVCGMHFDEREGVLFQIQADSPKECKGNPEFWLKGKGSGWYESQKLVCLCLNLSKIKASLASGLPNISSAHASDLIFLEIVAVDDKRTNAATASGDDWKCVCGFLVFAQKKLCPKCGKPSPAALGSKPQKRAPSQANLHPTVRFVDGSPHRIQFRVKCMSAQDFDVLVALSCEYFASLGQRPLDPPQNLMLYFPKNFMASFTPILKSLQNRVLLRFPMLGHIVGAPMENLEPPLYQRSPSFSFNLSCALKIPTLQNAWALQVRPSSTHLKAVLEAHRDAICFDKAQMHAFIGALTRRVSLIQGPPGTGKSYVGIKIVASLLQSSPRLKSPILCICHTNHALDQFLLALLSSGCIVAEDMVRLGSQTKNETLKGLEISRHPRYKEPVQSSRDVRELQWKARHDLEDFVEEINNGCFRFFNRDLELDLASLSGDICAALEYHSDFIPGCAWFIDSLCKTDKSSLPKKSPVSASNRGGQAAGGARPGPSSQPAPLRHNASDDDSFEIVTHQKLKSFSKLLREWMSGKVAPCSADVASASSAAILRFIDGSAVPKDVNIDVWTLNADMRLKLLKHFITAIVRRDALFGQPGQHAPYNDFVDTLTQARNMKKVQFLRSARVIGMTTSGASRYRSILAEIGSQVVLCEEAGEILESHVLASLQASTEQLILIGDHFQLRPHVEVMRLKESGGLGYSLDVSLFERLVRQAESIQLSPTELPFLLTLETQRRMRPEIADLIRFPLYPTLLDHESVVQYPKLPGFVESLWFFDHRFLEQGNAEDLSMKSYRNSGEAAMVVSVALYAIRNGVKVAIITPYVGQLLTLRELLKTQNLVLYIDERDQELLAEVDASHATQTRSLSVLLPSEIKTTLKDCVRLATVDNFQGEEEQLILVSTVRSNSQGKIGFLGEFNRVNVMFSRAKHGMIIFGNSTIVRAKTKQPSMYAQVLSIIGSKGLIGPHIGLCCQRHTNVVQCSSADDIKRHHDGGCLMPCTCRLQCGHTCPRLCHPDDADHVLYRCKESCTRMLSCGHGVCPQLCCDPCKCKETVSVTLPCGHALTMPCDDITSGVQRPCRVKVAFTVPHCQHVMQLPCSDVTELQAYMTENCSMHGQLVTLEIPDRFSNLLFGCKETCAQATRDCGHACSASCGSCHRNHAVNSGVLGNRVLIPSNNHAGSCSHSCHRRLFCKHACQGKCHDSGNCPPCSQPCRTECVHSKCSLKCSEPCSLCAETCVWTCDCSDDSTLRTCPMPCGVPCTKLPCNRRCIRVLPCGHRCPSICGEKCPESHCAECCSGDVRGQVVDLLENKTFGELDLDATPVIVLTCGHFFTVDTVDGVMGIDLFYMRDESGEFIGLRDLKSIQFSELEQLLCACPNCRIPISHAKRYGRVNNTLIVRYAARKHAQKCTEGLNERIDALQVSILQNSGRLPDERQTFVRKCRKYCDFVTQTPIRRCFELAQVASQRSSGSKDLHPLIELASMGDDESSVQALGLICRMLTECAQCQLATSLKSAQAQQARDEQSKYIGAVNGAMSKAQALCFHHKLRSSWSKAVQFYVFCAKNFYSYVTNTDREQLLSTAFKFIDTLESGTHFERENAGLVLELRKSLKDLLVLQGDELRMVMRAVNLGTHGSYGGHWFQCKNGHPYAIGECGGAMQRSSCPECGEAIGGEHHALDVGNSVAAGLLELAEMALGEDP